MPKLTRAPFLMVCLAIPLATWAADFWTNKPYQAWSAEETQKILEESPWAAKQKLIGTDNLTGYLADRHAGILEEDPNITYTLQFRSAQIMRQAQVRNSQITAHYDKMSAEQKAAFDASVDRFLNATFPDRIVVAVTFRSSEAYAGDLQTYWMEQSLPKLSMKVFLNTGTERLSLMSYSCDDNTFEFVFPRPKGFPPDGKISVEFVHPTIGQIQQQRIFMVFSLKKMLIDGKLVPEDWAPSGMWTTVVIRR